MNTLLNVRTALVLVVFAAFAVTGCTADQEFSTPLADTPTKLVADSVMTGNGGEGDVAAANGWGFVNYDDGNPVDGAVVELLDAFGNVVATAITDANGGFRFETVPTNAISWQIIVDETVVFADEFNLPTSGDLGVIVLQ